MSEVSKREQVYQLVQAHPFISQQELAEQLALSRSAVAGHIAALIKERRILGRAYVLPDRRPVVCIGGANVDRKLRTVGTFQMGTSNPVEQLESFGGVARNISENIARLGAPVALLSVLGDDAAGRALLAQAAAAGIDTRGSLQLPQTASGSYTAVLDAGGEMLLALAHMELCEQMTPAFLQSRSALRAAAGLTVADLNLPQDSLALLLQEAQQGGAPLVLVAVSQPKMERLPQSLQGLRLLILNRGELETRVGRVLPDRAAIAQACRKLQVQGAQDVVVTLGGGGVLFTGIGGVHRLDAPPAAVVDVTGAGDAFAAAVCWSLHQTPKDLALACRRGLHLAALTLESPATVRQDVSAATLDAVVEQ